MSAHIHPTIARNHLLGPVILSIYNRLEVSTFCCCWCFPFLRRVLFFCFVFICTKFIAESFKKLYNCIVLFLFVLYLKIKSRIFWNSLCWYEIVKWIHLLKQEIFSLNLHLCSEYVHIYFFLMCRLSTWMSPQLEWTPTPEDTYGMSWRRKKRTSWSFWQLILWMKQIYWQVCLQGNISLWFFPPFSTHHQWVNLRLGKLLSLNYYSWTKIQTFLGKFKTGQRVKGQK